MAVEVLGWLAAVACLACYQPAVVVVGLAFAGEASAGSSAGLEDLVASVGSD